MKQRAKAFFTGLITAAVIAGHAAPAAAEELHWQEPTVKWNDEWPRFRLTEAAALVGLTVGSIVISTQPMAQKPLWTGGILFDDAARKFFRATDNKTQQSAASVSDTLYKGAVFVPYIVDNYIVALGIHQSADVALEMTLIDMQSLGFSGVVALGAEHVVRRERPYISDCKVEPCIVDNQSFLSGHAAATFTMAGLTCVHHQHFPLYGGGLPDTMACVGMLTVATTTGVLRLVSDRHYASDVISGSLLGLFSGYVLPSLLHYGFGKTRSKPLLKTTYGNIAPVPLTFTGGAGLGVTGIF